MPVIRGKTSSLTSQLCAGDMGVAEILFEQPVRLLWDYHGFHYRGSTTIFCVSPGNGRRLDITSAEPITDTISNITAQKETAMFKSACLTIGKTQQVGVNLHICGFHPAVGLQKCFRSQHKTRATPGKRHSARPVHGGLFSIGLRVMMRVI